MPENDPAASKPERSGRKARLEMMPVAHTQSQPPYADVSCFMLTFLA